MLTAKQVAENIRAYANALPKASDLAEAMARFAKALRSLRQW